jgi:hypothetical protein
LQHLYRPFCTSADDIRSVELVPHPAVELCFHLHTLLQTVSINDQNSSNSCWVNWTGSSSRRTISL